MEFLDKSRVAVFGTRRRGLLCGGGACALWCRRFDLVDNDVDLGDKY